MNITNGSFWNMTQHIKEVYFHDIMDLILAFMFIVALTASGQILAVLSKRSRIFLCSKDVFWPLTSTGKRNGFMCDKNCGSMFSFCGHSRLCWAFQVDVELPMDGSEASEEIKRDGGSNVLHVFTRGSFDIRLQA